MGVTQHTMGSDTSTAISNLLLVTGNYMRPGTGAYPLRGHNNVQGASDHGAMPDKLPGYQSVNDPEVRARFEAAWGVRLPATKGLDNHEMVDAIHDGKLKALYLFGEEMSLVDSNANYVRTRSRKLDFLVVQEIFFSARVNLPTWSCPPAPASKRKARLPAPSGGFSGCTRSSSRSAGSRPDWRIIQDVANTLGAGWNYQHPSKSWLKSPRSLRCLPASLTIVWRDTTRCNGRWLPTEGISRCCTPKGLTFPMARPGFSRCRGREPVDQPDAEYDLHLNNGRLLEHFHEGNMTYRVQGIREKTPDTFVEVSPELAEERGIKSGTRVKLISRYGQVRVRAQVTDRVRGKQLYMPMNSVKVPVNG